MSYLILGVALLAGFLLAGKWFVNAEPKVIIRTAKWLLFGVIGAVILFFLLTGKIAWAFYALPALLPWIMRARAVARTAKNFSRMYDSGPSGNASEVESAYLRMHLDHDSGAMSGVVLQGRHEGRNLHDLEPSELVSLFHDYQRLDDESARLMAAFLDREYAEWRDAADADGYDDTSSGQGSRGASAGPMSRDEALRVLGLSEGVSEQEIKDAYHRLIANLHPDKGGSDYLSSKINEARDVLLG